ISLVIMAGLSLVDPQTKTDASAKGEDEYSIVHFNYNNNYLSIRKIPTGRLIKVERELRPSTVSYIPPPSYLCLFEENSDSQLQQVGFGPHPYHLSHSYRLSTEAAQHNDTMSTSIHGFLRGVGKGANILTDELFSKTI
ncbi:hypothetical protein L195_g050497, partial [Trifolium pratense]